jgi:hypothetical protein
MSATSPPDDTPAPSTARRRWWCLSLTALVVGAAVGAWPHLDLPGRPYRGSLVDCDVHSVDGDVQVVDPRGRAERLDLIVSKGWGADEEIVTVCPLPLQPDVSPRAAGAPDAPERSFTYRVDLSQRVPMRRDGPDPERWSRVREPEAYHVYVRAEPEAELTPPYVSLGAKGEMTATFCVDFATKPDRPAGEAVRQDGAE